MIWLNLLILTYIRCEEVALKYGGLSEYRSPKVLYSPRGVRDHVNVDRGIDVTHKVTLQFSGLSVKCVNCKLDSLLNCDNLLMGDLIQYVIRWQSGALVRV